MSVGLTSSFTTMSVVLPPGSSRTSALLVTTSGFTTAGTYVVVVSGANGPIIHTVAITLSVTPDFVILAGPANPTSFVAGGSTSAVISVRSLGFAGLVDITASAFPK